MICLTLSATSLRAEVTHGVDTKECAKRLRSLIERRVSGYSRLSDEQKRFLERYFLPVTGLRGLQRGPHQFHACSVSKHCVVFEPDIRDEQPGKELRLEWVRGTTEPSIESTDTARILRIPYGYDFSARPKETADLIKRFLVSDVRHPFIAMREAMTEREAIGEPRIFDKQVQAEAAEAAIDTLERGERKFLFVAPTGTGKTRVLETVLRHQLENGENKGHKLHIVTADSNFLANQLYLDIAEMNGGLDFEIIRWGGPRNKAWEMSELIAHAKKSDKPVVLITTIQSLKSPRVGLVNGEAVNKPILRKLKPLLGTLIYDEAHHTGADRTAGVLDGIMKGTDAFLYGTTATPVHARRSIQELFDNRAYWAYLDNKDTYRNRPAGVERSTTEVIDQLSHAIQAGELTPFDRVYFLDPKDIAQGESLFKLHGKQEMIVDGETQQIPLYVIDPDHYEAVGRKIVPLLETHKRGFLSFATVTEATAMAHLLNQLSPTKRFALLHSDMPKAQQEAVARDLRVGRIDYIVTCKMLDEGLNFPEMDFYFDGNKSVGPRQFLQRAGRILRIAKDKESVDIATLTDINETNVRDMLVFLDRLTEGKLIVPVKGGHSGPSAPSLVEGARPLSDDEYRAELEKLRQRARAFWEGVTQTPATRTAQELNQFVDTLKKADENPRMPSSSPRSDERDFYVRVWYMRNNPEFIRALSDDARQVVLSARPSPALRAAEELNRFVERLEKEKLDPRMPKNNDGSEVALYSLVQRNKTNEEFLDALSPNARSVLPESTSHAERAADAVNEFVMSLIERGESPRLPTSRENQALFVRIKRFKEDQAFLNSLTDEARAMFKR